MIGDSVLEMGIILPLVSVTLEMVFARLSPIRYADVSATLPSVFINHQGRIFTSTLLSPSSLPFWFLTLSSYIFLPIIPFS